MAQRRVSWTIGAMRRTALATLDRLGVRLDVDASLGNLGVAQRQIVAIARALVRDARVIFMDEPTSSLAQHETRQLLDTVRMLSGDGIGVVFVSHRLAEVLEISSRVTVLRDGKLVGVFPTGGMTQSLLTELMTGKSFDQAISAGDRTDSPVVLTVSGLSASRRIPRRLLQHPQGRDGRADRSSRCRANRARAVDLRHAPS